MRDPRTNPGIKHYVEQARAALAEDAPEEALNG